MREEASTPEPETRASNRVKAEAEVGLEGGGLRRRIARCLRRLCTDYRVARRVGSKVAGLAVVGSRFRDGGDQTPEKGKKNLWKTNRSGQVLFTSSSPLPPKGNGNIPTGPSPAPGIPVAADTPPHIRATLASVVHPAL